MMAWLKKVKRTVGRGGDVLFSVLSLPIVFPLYVRAGWTQLIGILLWIPSMFVWFSVYLYGIRILFGLVGFSFDAESGFGSLPADPHAYFGTWFFVCFFPLMAYYLFAVRSDRLDMEKVREYFAEHIPTKAEIEETERARRHAREHRSRLIAFFVVRFGWTFLALLVLFTGSLLLTGEVGGSGFLGVILFSAVSAAMLAAPFSSLAESRHQSRIKKGGAGIRKR